MLSLRNVLGLQGCAMMESRHGKDERHGVKSWFVSDSKKTNCHCSAKSCLRVSLNPPVPSTNLRGRRFSTELKTPMPSNRKDLVAAGQGLRKAPAPAMFPPRNKVVLMSTRK